MVSFTQKSCAPAHLLTIELQQACDEGINTSSLQEKVNLVNNMDDINWVEKQKQATEIFLKIKEEPCIVNYPYIEPSNWDDILKNINKPKSITLNIDRGSLIGRVKGGILGKCIGCLLGKPVEGWDHKKIISFMHETNNFPINKYLFDSINEMYFRKYHLSESWSLPLTGMPEDDDINYLLVSKSIISKFGIHFTP